MLIVRGFLVVCLIWRGFIWFILRSFIFCRVSFRGRLVVSFGFFLLVVFFSSVISVCLILVRK